MTLVRIARPWMRDTWLASALVCVLCACGNVASTSTSGPDGSVPEEAGPLDAGPSGSPLESGTPVDASRDAGTTGCVYDHGGLTPDAAARFHGSCANGCPPGTICAIQIGGVAGGGGEYCAPIPDACREDLTCACLARCACGSASGKPESCADPSDASGGALTCDDGIR